MKRTDMRFWYLNADPQSGTLPPAGHTYSNKTIHPHGAAPYGSSIQTHESMGALPIKTTTLFWDFNIALSQIGRSFGQQLKKEIMGLTYVINQMDLTDIYKTFHPSTKNNITPTLHLTECSTKLATFLGWKQISTDTRKLK